MIFFHTLLIAPTVALILAMVPYIDLPPESPNTSKERYLHLNLQIFQTFIDNHLQNTIHSSK